VVYKHSLDLIFYMIGAASENELMLHVCMHLCSRCHDLTQPLYSLR
jgi:hypothetical protein